MRPFSISWVSCVKEKNCMVVI